MVTLEVWVHLLNLDDYRDGLPVVTLQDQSEKLGLNLAVGRSILVLVHIKTHLCHVSWGHTDVRLWICVPTPVLILEFSPQTLVRFRTHHIRQLGYNLIESDLEDTSLADVFLLLAPQITVNGTVLYVLLRILSWLSKQCLELVEVRKILLIHLLEHVVVMPFINLLGKSFILPENLTEQIFVYNGAVVLILIHMVKVVFLTLQNFVLAQVDDPEGSLLPATSIRLLKDVTLAHVLNSDVVELAPLASVVIFNECVVVA